MAISVWIYIKKDYVARDGRVPIYLGVIVNSKTKPPIPLEQRVAISHWDNAKKRVKAACKDQGTINAVILREESKATDIIQRYKGMNRPLTYEIFLKEMAGINIYDFQEYAKEYVQGMRGLQARATIDKVEEICRKIQRFRHSLDINDIDYKFLKDFRQHLATEVKDSDGKVIKKVNGKNTIYTNMKILKRMVREAIRLEIIKKNPFDNFRLEKVKVEHDTLELEELKKYEDLFNYNIPFYLKKTLSWFLLATYTGRRFQDLQDFYNWEFHVDYIKLYAMKRVGNRQERKPVIVFVNNRILKICDFIRNGKLDCASNQKSNKYLKELNSLVGVTKRITFHSARHTFATLNKKFKTDTHVNKELLGHDSITSTLVYEKVDGELLKEAMLKWNAV